uniref:Uncharacterized protein n=1 Tax=Anopheles atroparvus TaxID=41427 RepID=A0AAG5CW18_ANOAO
RVGTVQFSQAARQERNEKELQKKGTPWQVDDIAVRRETFVAFQTNPTNLQGSEQVEQKTHSGRRVKEIEKRKRERERERERDRRGEKSKRIEERKIAWVFHCVRLFEGCTVGRVRMCECAYVRDVVTVVYRRIVWW